MPGFLDIPLELRNQIYDILLHDVLDRQFRGVMVVSEPYIHDEFKQAIKHMTAAKQLNYELDITFSHGRPFFSLTWIRFPALSPTINTMIINVDLRVREPFPAWGMTSEVSIPHDHELAHLIEDAPESFAEQMFDYIAILLKTLANLLSNGDPNFKVLYTEYMVVNFRTPTMLDPRTSDPRQIHVNPDEARELLDTMRNTLQANAKAFQAFDAVKCELLSPLIQIGSLRFATEGRVWAEGHNMILAHDDFQWLRY